MARLGIRIGAVPHTIGWDGLVLFVSGLGEESALYREQNRDVADWSTNAKQAQILADIYDMIGAFFYGTAKMHRASMRRPQAYKRPWADDRSVKRIGSAPIPISEFEDWYYGEH